ncbi:hemerythrin domain-containing protein [Roseomonas sp. HF4]|uniref:hemerythrin domain-containing protein n=1 Tax=Roseomonas sp. HF4 TaxID=2562313 RepID=UPI0010C07FF0|nr:hemerythrin domain-containing protein [Roseomonas sp. HF4]
MPMINDNRLKPTRDNLFGPAPAPRRPASFDLYGPVHKGLRLALTGLLVRLGAQDWTDAEGTAALLDAMRAQLEISAAHLRHEEEHIHRLLDARQPEGAIRPRHQHEAHDAAFADLALMIETIAATPGNARPALGRRLYLRFSTFVAEDFEHMAEEEQAVQPMLQALLTDEEMQAIEAGILAAIPPARAQAFLRLMLPAMSRPERAAFLIGARAKAPDDTAVAMIEGSAMNSLDAADWRDLQKRLALAA